MAFTIAEEKAALRRAVRAELAQMTREKREESDSALFARFLALPRVEAAKTIFAFWGIPGKEPDTARLIKALADRGKVIGLPRMLPGHQMEVRRYDPDRPLVSVSFGILEPDEGCPILDQKDIDLALVPALCYDRRGYRLGFGGGYYDRWLAGFSGARVGLCRELVLQNVVPTEEHDSKVELLLTEAETLCLSR